MLGCFSRSILNTVVLLVHSSPMTSDDLLTFRGPRSQGGSYGGDSGAWWRDRESSGAEEERVSRAVGTEEQPEGLPPPSVWGERYSLLNTAECPQSPARFITIMTNLSKNRSYNRSESTTLNEHMHIQHTLHQHTLHQHTLRPVGAPEAPRQEPRPSSEPQTWVEASRCR